VTGSTQFGGSAVLAPLLRQASEIAYIGNRFGKRSAVISVDKLDYLRTIYL
jgi:hypothetical protein